MSSSVLGSLSLGYQLLWDRARQPAAIRLFVDADASPPVHAHHLLATLGELWPEQAPPLMLSVQSLPLFLDLLTHGTPDAPWLEVPHSWLADPAVAAAVEGSRQRGLPLVWRGTAMEQAPPALADRFRQRLLTLTAKQALACLVISRQQDSGAMATPCTTSPAETGQILEHVSSQALARHCLDQQAAWALAGWPDEDVLHARAGLPVQPDRQKIEQLLSAIEADASIEAIEHVLSDEPVLAVRFLQYTNAPGLGLRHEIESIRQGLMVLGLSPLQAWLQQQLSQACDDPDLGPVRTALVMRAHLMEKLLEAGEEHKLRSETYLCGLLADIEPLLGEPLGALLDRLPLSWRIRHALLQNEGPYAPYLAIAAALALPDTRATQQLSEALELDMEDVNRALLRTLATVTSRPRRRA